MASTQPPMPGTLEAAALLAEPARKRAARDGAMSFSRTSHWDGVHAEKDPEALGWYQPHPAVSLALIERAELRSTDAILDAGGGVSSLAGHLLERGYAQVTVVDVSAEALAHAQERLGVRAALVRWMVADVLSLSVPNPVMLWHDRAVFHFLTEACDRDAYREALKRCLAPGGYLVMATFADDGPVRCSGLEVVRYSEAQLRAELAEVVDEVETRRETHTTPAGRAQSFVYGLYRRRT